MTPQDRHDPSFDDFVRSTVGPVAVGPERVEAVIAGVLGRLDRQNNLISPHIFPDVIAPTMRLAFPIAALALGMLIGVQLTPSLERQQEDYTQLFSSGTIIQGAF
jgi:hypothetical protein